MARRWLRLLGVGAALAAMLGMAGPVAARDLIVALKTEPSSLDPQYHALTPNTQISHTLFDALVHADAKLQPRPALGIQFVDIPEFPDLGTQVSLQISSAIAGQVTVEQALDRGQQLAEDVAERYRSRLEGNA
mgnify:CR=1 FL=1